MTKWTQNIKDRLLSQPWLIGLSNATFVFAGFAIGKGDTLLGLGLGVLATGMLALQYNMEQQSNLDKMADAYSDGFNHSKRRTGARR